jgi:hypothetical protein
MMRRRKRDVLPGDRLQTAGETGDVLLKDKRNWANSSLNLITNFVNQV